MIACFLLCYIFFLQESIKVFPRKLEKIIFFMSVRRARFIFLSAIFCLFDRICPLYCSKYALSIAQNMPLYCSKYALYIAQNMPFFDIICPLYCSKISGGSMIHGLTVFFSSILHLHFYSQNINNWGGQHLLTA